MRPFGSKKKASRGERQPESPPCNCPSATTWTDQQRRAFGDLPVKFQDCPRHDR